MKKPRLAGWGGAGAGRRRGYWGVPATLASVAHSICQGKTKLWYDPSIQTPLIILSKWVLRCKTTLRLPYATIYYISHNIHSFQHLST